MSTICDYMSSPVISINLDASGKNGISKMLDNNVSSLLIKKDDEYVGIFTKTDWIDMVLKEVCNPNTIKVSELMVSPIITVDINDNITKTSKLIEKNHIRHLAVTDKAMIVGMFSVKDLEKYYCHLHDQSGIAHY